MAGVETYEAAFTSSSGTNLAGIPVAHLDLPGPFISHGLPYNHACAKHVNAFNASRVFIIASGSLSRQTDKLDLLISTIGQDKIAGIQKGMAPHSLWSEILSVTNTARVTNADCIVTLGAGSLTDAAKLVVFCLANAIESPSQLAAYALGSPNSPASVARPSIPLICIPTTLSGGEYFALAGGTNDTTHQKTGFLHSGMGANLVVLDADLCRTTPAYHWLSTGVRAIDHCVEALCSPDATPASNERAAQGLKLLVPALLRCHADAADLRALHACQMGVRLAMENIRAGVSMGGSHAIGHQLGPLGVPHGVTSCILCPAVMKFNIAHAGADNPQIATRQQHIQTLLWTDDDVAGMLREGGLDAQTSDLGDVLDTLIRFLGLPRRLTEFGIEAGKIPGLARNALEDFWARTNPVPLVEAAQVEEILAQVL